MLTHARKLDFPARDRDSLPDWRVADLQKLLCHELRQPGQSLSTSAPWTATTSA